MCGVCGARCGGASAPDVAETGPGQPGLALGNCGRKNQNRISNGNEQSRRLSALPRVLVERVDDWTLDVGVQPGSPSERHAQLELDASLCVW